MDRLARDISRPQQRVCPHPFFVTQETQQQSSLYALMVRRGVELPSEQRKRAAMGTDTSREQVGCKSAFNSVSGETGNRTVA